MNQIVILAIVSAIIGLVVWVARINYLLAKSKKNTDILIYENRKLSEANARYHLLISKIEKNQIQSKISVEKFVDSLNNAKHADDFNKLLEESFGSLVNRKDIRP